ncbi:hypothetical protein A3D77_00600 [Candidatus Gottesmanbacteria bacterium RIFCSPHIGHO2_02_FULL_39_11]|uniref:VTT domain-containing protein n=1 Tax=Candidatus Gottesmanbacteria bacterium RIFCSPHIGHO2_02_FULL_39_11 TaxID=1798382 RepID=A0A1F5ZL42_9BACT|nr:MAG: hypothetical protein A3D77_00600 [Candidatus Gottesmanbacteria bacterium RIFCSPHIGHO2_02_FULL_39_11]
MKNKKKYLLKNKIETLSESFWFRLGIFVFCVLLLLFVFDNREYLGHFKKLGYLGIFLVNVVGSSTVFLPLPSIISVFVSGSVWNPVWVGIVSGIGNSVGELVGYFLGFGGRGIYDHLRQGEKKMILRLEGWFKKGGFLLIVFSAMIPIPIFDFVGITAGLMNYPIWKFILATALGRILRNIIIAWSGARIIN